MLDTIWKLINVACITFKAKCYFLMHCTLTLLLTSLMTVWLLLWRMSKYCFNKVVSYSVKSWMKFSSNFLVCVFTGRLSASVTRSVSTDSTRMPTSSSSLSCFSSSMSIDCSISFCWILLSWDCLFLVVYVWNSKQYK